jgi:hypothetical protein
LLALPVLVLSIAFSIVHGTADDAQRYMVVASSSLEPSEVCSGQKGKLYKS